MSDNAQGDNSRHRNEAFKIVSVARKTAAGVSFGRSGQQFVVLGAPIQHWVVHKVGKNKYKLKIGAYHYVGEDGHKVLASTNSEDEREWDITYQEWQGAYLIALADDPSLGWTAPEPLSETEPHGAIELKQILVKHSNPPQYSTSQLWEFVFDD